VAHELDAVGALAAGHRLQARGVVGDLGQRHFAGDRRRVARTRIGAGDVAAPARQVAGEVADRRLGRDDLDATMGSSTIGLAARMASTVALRPAVTKATSLPSTAWVLPS
jgi:hypothetical protein